MLSVAICLGLMLAWATTNHVLDERLYRPRCWGRALKEEVVGEAPYRSVVIGVPLVRAPALVRATALVLYVVGQPIALLVGAGVVSSSVVLFRTGTLARAKDLPLATYALGTKLLARDRSAPQTMAHVAIALATAGVVSAGVTALVRREVAAPVAFGVTAALCFATSGLLWTTRALYARLFTATPS